MYQCMVRSIIRVYGVDYCHVSEILVLGRQHLLEQSRLKYSTPTASAADHSSGVMAGRPPHTSFLRPSTTCAKALMAAWISCGRQSKL